MMDRKSLLGLFLIGIILVSWSLFFNPAKDQAAENKRKKDSLELAEKTSKPAAPLVKQDTSTPAKTSEPDSVTAARKASNLGPFNTTAGKPEQLITLENDYMKVTLSSKGGKVVSTQLKEGYLSYHTKKPVVLFEKDSSSFGLQLITADARNFITDTLNFDVNGKSAIVTGNDSATVSFRLPAGENKYIEFAYGLRGKSRMLAMKVNMVNMQDVLSPSVSHVGLRWKQRTIPHEKDLIQERQKTTVYYKFDEDEDAAHLSETSDEKITSDAFGTKWISFKQMFFSSALILDKPLETKPVFEQRTTASNNYLKDLSAEFAVPLANKENSSFGMRFYFGPNHFQTLKKYDIGLEEQIPLGWWIFKYVNRGIVIPIFNFLDSFDISYGIIILILTIVIKLILFPFAYKTYLSSAKMRVLKPEISEINEKYKNEDPLKKQQATMALYKKAGINPLAGCIPVLLQMPVLIALFNFFPAAIELRQEGFLWAEDLSTYDSVLNWSGWEIPWYGSHVSLFALLMCGSTLLYTWSNNQLMGSNDQMPGMKIMMYLMPVIFLVVMNSYSAGLSYYYFLANLITFGQTYVMRGFVNEEEIHRKIQENKKKPVKVSSFQQKLEKLARERQQMQAQQKKKK